jgi:hypothetical protein
MKYLCLAYFDPELFKATPKDELGALVAKAKEYDKKLKATGRLWAHGSLADPKDTRNIFPRNGKATITDGPYIESKEQVGGWFIIEAENMDEAQKVAMNHPAAHLGEDMSWGIEIRQVDFFENF